MMTEFTFYVAPLLIGLAGGLVRGMRPQKAFRSPANDTVSLARAGGNGRFAANDTARILKA